MPFCVGGHRAAFLKAAGILVGVLLSAQPVWAASDKAGGATPSTPASAPEVQPSAAPSSQVGMALQKLLAGAGDNLTIAGVQLPRQMLADSYGSANDEPPLAAVSFEPAVYCGMGATRHLPAPLLTDDSRMPGHHAPLATLR